MGRGFKFVGNDRHGFAKVPTQIGATEARSQLAMMLLNTTDERLTSFTAERLASMYRVKLGAIDDMLAAERERRAEYARRHG